MKRFIATSLAVACMLAGSKSALAVDAIEGTITNMITTAAVETVNGQEHIRFGGCIVKMTNDNASPLNPSNVNGSCGNQWLSADCSTDYLTSKSAQRAMFDTINLAYVTETTVRLVFGTEKHNNFCVIKSAELK